MTGVNTTVGTIEHVDPTQVIVEAIVRSTAPLDKDFLASIRQNGVLTPIFARGDGPGNVIVRAGQRRTLAAREVGLRSIPVNVVGVHEAISGRILQQIVEEDVDDEATENEHENRSGFSNPLQDSGVALVNGAAEQRRRRRHRSPSE